jgi:hypothetical protein
MTSCGVHAELFVLHSFIVCVAAAALIVLGLWLCVRRATTADTFFSRFSGGYKLFSDADASAGVQLAAGSGSWSSLSDVNVRLKKHFRPAQPSPPEMPT